MVCTICGGGVAECSDVDCQYLSQRKPILCAIGRWLVVFFMGVQGLPDGRPDWIWLLMLLDVSVLMVVAILLSLLKELFVGSRFCRYAVYKNDTQQITLYKFKSQQHFNWQRIRPDETTNLPAVLSFGGLANDG